MQSLCFMCSIIQEKGKQNQHKQNQSIDFTTLNYFMLRLMIVIECRKLPDLGTAHLLSNNSIKFIEFWYEIPDFILNAFLAGNLSNRKSFCCIWSFLQKFVSLFWGNFVFSQPLFITYYICILWWLKAKNMPIKYFINE